MKNTAVHQASNTVELNNDVASQQSIVQSYYELTKPGITQMVAMTTFVGLYLAIPTGIVEYLSVAQNWYVVFATMIGTIAISSGSCVVNHVLERDTDARMKRTQNRPIPAGIISARSATVFGVVLTLVGAGLLSTVNLLTFWLAVATWVSYVVVYTPMKKSTSLAVIVGGIPGALPFAGGWTAVDNRFGMEALALFAILFFWQMPHFYALSWMYKSDYKDGGVVLRSADETQATTIGYQMMLWSVFFALACLAPTVLGLTGWMYGILATAFGVWLSVASVLFIRTGTHAAARKVLLTSYAVLVGVLILMLVDKV